MYKTSVNHYLYQLVSATLAKVRDPMFSYFLPIAV